MNTTASGARRLIETFFDKLGGEGDTDALLALLSPEIRVETPFAPAGQPMHFRGKDEIRARFGGARGAMGTFEFYDIEILATEDSERWLATCRSRGRHTDGREYANTYCWIFRVRDGRILWWREYYDPQQVMPFLAEMSMGRNC